MKLIDKMPPPGESLNVVVKNRQGKIIEYINNLGTKIEDRELKPLGSFILAERWTRDF